jgi:hypothetical protein
MAETLSNGTIINSDGHAPEYAARRGREAEERATNLIRAILTRGDLTAADRASLEGAADNLLIAKAAREARTAPQEA